MAENTKTARARRIFVSADGTQSRSSTSDWVELRFEILGAERDENNRAVAVDTVVVTPETMKEVWHAAAGTGCSEHITNAYANVPKLAEQYGMKEHKTRGFADVVKLAIESMIEDMANGIWVEAKEGVGNLSTLVEAILRTYREVGQEIADEVATRKSLIAHLQDEKAAKDARGNPIVKKHLAAVEAERAAKRAAKLAAAMEDEEAATSAAEGLSGLLKIAG